MGDDTEELCKRLDQHKHLSPHQLRKVLKSQGRIEEERLDRHADWAWIGLWVFIGSCIAYGVITMWKMNDCGCG